MKSLSNRELLVRWLWNGGLGAVLIGAGLCCTLEVSHWKHAGAPTLHWVAAGTGSLCVFMAGLAFLANAVRYRVRMDKRKDLF
jgi:hypothetical protein